MAKQLQVEFLQQQQLQSGSSTARIIEKSKAETISTASSTAKPIGNFHLQYILVHAVEFLLANV